MQNDLDIYIYPLELTKVLKNFGSKKMAFAMLWEAEFMIGKSDEIRIYYLIVGYTLKV